MAIPFRLLQSLRFATLDLRPMVDQHSSMSLFGQHIFYTNICPEIAIISGFMRSLPLANIAPPEAAPVSFVPTR